MKDICVSRKDETIGRIKRKFISEHIQVELTVDTNAESDDNVEQMRIYVRTTMIDKKGDRRTPSYQNVGCDAEQARHLIFVLQSALSSLDGEEASDGE